MKHAIPVRKEVLHVLGTMATSSALLLIAVSSVSAQSVVPKRSAESPPLYKTTSVVEMSVADARRLGAARLVVLTAIVPNDAGRWQAGLIGQTSPRLTIARGLTTKTKRSKLKTTLIGAAIGGSVGAAGGLYYAETTKDGAYPQAIPAFAGIGAGIGAITGFIVALF